MTGVGPPEFVRGIREDTNRAKLLYLATEHGMYVTFDDGALWQPLKQNLPDTPVHDIKVEERDLVIATHGRSFFVMDNIVTLRQWGAQTSSTGLYLFKPEDVRRGLDRALAIDYSLKQPAEKVTIDVLDGQGKLIRSFSGTAADASQKPAGPPSDEDFFRRPPDPKPAVAAGINRLNWDLRYPGATDFPGLIMWAASTRGPIAPPSTYQVRVTADGQTQTQTFAIKREPHLLADVTDADLQKQFDLAMKIRDKTSQANDAVLLVRGIKPQIQDRKGKLDSKAGPTAKALDELDTSLTAVEVEVYQVKNQSSQDPLNYPIKLNNKIAALQGIVESGDMPPTDQSVDIYQMLSGRLEAELSKLDTAVKTKLPQVNQMLQKQKLPPIKAEPLKPPSTSTVPPER